MITTVRVARAEPIAEDLIAEIHIAIADNLPDRSRPEVEFHRRMDADAHNIAQALRNSLPGGTFDRLVAELLRMKVSDLTMPRPPCQL